MPDITVTQTQVDGVDNADLNTSLAKKRFDGSSYTTGLITGRFSINNEVHTTGTVFKADNVEYASASPPFTWKTSVVGGTTVTLDRAAAAVEVGDIILVGSYNYWGGSGGSYPALLSGFTNITTGGYTTYFGLRWSYRVATSSDTSGSLTVNQGNRTNSIAVFKITNVNTPVKANHSATNYFSYATDPIVISNSTNGAVIVAAMSTGTYSTPNDYKYTDSAGDLKLITNLEDQWGQEIPNALQGGLFAYRGVAAGELIGNQSAEFTNTGFMSQLIIHFTD